MDAENTKKPKAATEADAANEVKSVQDQVLDAIKRSQEATLQVVGTWSEHVAKMVHNLPELPKLPIPEALSKPSELSDQFFEFAQKLMKSQQEFAKKLVDTLAHHEKTEE
jgi:3-methyladenine DNA glycosylase AlkC